MIELNGDKKSLGLKYHENVSNITFSWYFFYVNIYVN